MSAPVTRRPGPRGWTGPTAGAETYVQAPTEWRGTTVQVCGLWPFAAGAGSPITGVPVGRHLRTHATVGCDPISWFQRAQLISNPSAFILSIPGIGKSTLSRRMVLGLAGYGTNSLILGDLKPDYVDLIEAMGGQVITLGPGRATLNVLDRAAAVAAAERLTGKARRQVLGDAHARRVEMIVALLNIWKGTPPASEDRQILDRALRVLDDRTPGASPVLADLVNVIEEGPDQVRAVTLDEGDRDRYATYTRRLRLDLTGILDGEMLGDMFAGQTTTPMRMDRSVAFDISALEAAPNTTQAAALLACWTYGFSNLAAAQALSDAGVEPYRPYLVVQDEIWRALRMGEGMPDRVDSLTRLNRALGVGQIMISHTMSDLLALPTAQDRAKAKGFIERAGIVITGALPMKEFRDHLADVVPYSDEEMQLVSSWHTPPSWAQEGADMAPPGQGKFLIKVGSRPGIPIQTYLTAVERDLNDTNKRWNVGARSIA